MGSGKWEAGSRKQEAGSGKREVGSGRWGLNRRKQENKKVDRKIS